MNSNHKVKDVNKSLGIIQKSYMPAKMIVAFSKIYIINKLDHHHRLCQYILPLLPHYYITLQETWHESDFVLF